MDKVKTGKLIKDARIQKNLTQTELGDLLGVSNKAVSRWEKGDSFPDVGIIENISIILDIKIQDIITGELEAKEDDVITEVIRYSKMQLANRRRKIIESIVAIVLVCNCILIGNLGLSHRPLFIFSQAYKEFTLILVLTEILFIFLNQSRNIVDEKCDLAKRKWIMGIKIATIIFGIIAPYVSTVMVVADKNPFGLPDAEIGAFESYQLQAVFFINIVLLIYDVYRYVRFDYSLHFENLIAIYSIFIAAFWGDLFSRIADIQTVFYGIYLRAGILTINMMVSIAVIILLKKVITKKS